MNDPFAVLGLDARASAADVRAARRRLAKQHHPDAGGDVGRMRTLNEAAASALELIGEAAPTPDPTWHGGERDMPSFTVEALPAEAFEALLVATSAIGEVIDDDPPYAMEILLTDPLSCWCRLELVPDAGASTVSITIGAVDGRPRPTTEQVRDMLIMQLNALDW